MPFSRLVAAALPALLVPLALTPATCQDSRTLGPEARPSARAEAVAPAAPAMQEAVPGAPTSVKVTVRMVIQKHYGLLAYLAGNRDSVESHMTYDPRKNWWDNPLVVYADAPLPHPHLSADADSAGFSGRGESANVTVGLTLVPHLDVAYRTGPRGEAMKGTLTTMLTTVSDFYDGCWTEMARVEDKPLAFDFDTRDPSRRAEVVATETRAVSAFELERYTRDQQKWEPRSAWPQKPESGDWRITVGAKDAKLVITSYRYAEPGPTGPAK